MPLLGTRGAASAQGFGFGVGGTANTWFSTPSVGDNARSVQVNSSNILFAYSQTSGDQTSLINASGTSASAGAYLAYRQVSGNAVFDSNGNYYDCTYNNSSVQTWYIAKYDSSGTNVWAKQISFTTYYFSDPRVLVDSSGNVYLIGGYRNSYFSATVYGICAVKLNSSGALSWAYIHTPATGTPGENIYGNGVPVFDNSGNIIFVSATSKSPTSTVLFRLNTSGTMTLYREFIGFGVDTYGGSVAVDSSGNYYINGSRTSPNQPAVLKADSSFTTLWAYYLNDPGGDFFRTSGSGMILDTTDNSMLIGNFYIYNAPSRMCIAKITTSGSLSWIRSLGYSTSTTRPAVTSSLSMLGNSYYAAFLTSSSAYLFKGLKDGTGTGTGGNYSYNTVSTTSGMTSISITPSNFTMSSTSITPTVSNSTSTVSIPSMTRTVI